MIEKYSPQRGAPRGVPAAAGPLADLARAAGLELQAVVAAGPLPAEIGKRLDAWLDAGRAGEMGYLARGRPHLTDLRRWKPWGRSLALFSLSYARASGGFKGGGKVARYALGRDYHHLLGRRLEKLGRRLRKEGLVRRFRAVTDAAPLLEREWALRGGLGFRGKNTLLLHRIHGPWVLLGELLVEAEWPPWVPPAPQPSCGSCTRCLEACPTGAFPRPYEIDSRRCISYLTIEKRGPIPRALRPLLGEWVFGCDVCLEVCPFGSSQSDQGELWGTLPALEQLTLEDLLGLSRPAFERAFRGSPLRRPGWAGLLRNACVVLGNLGRGAAALEKALGHEEPLVRGHAAWALGILGERTPLETARAGEEADSVREEIEAALAACT
ncbi:MAG: tRNA epoxyqueuosine(34) reductase QueG [Planctomycetota bacterium]